MSKKSNIVEQYYAVRDEEYDIKKIWCMSFSKIFSLIKEIKDPSELIIDCKTINKFIDNSNKNEVTSLNQKVPEFVKDVILSILNNTAFGRSGKHPYRDIFITQEVSIVFKYKKYEIIFEGNFEDFIQYSKDREINEDLLLKMMIAAQN